MTSPGYPSLYDNDQRQPPLQPGEDLGGKYRIEDVLGSGAMGVVVRAWHVELEQPVAVKFLYPEFARNADGAERFRREARAAAKIKNQHVARVLDVGTLEDKNIPYIVMEYLEGRDLSQEIRGNGPLPVGLAVRYLMQACEAVAEAHERGIVHRDLKPANLFLSEGAHGERMVKVLDFGISKVNGVGGAQQFSLTDTATLMGSPAYMSPEQLESSRNVDGRADIWSLGVILHELILGRVPFNGDSVPQLVRSILAGTRATLVQHDANLHGLESVVARCLCQEREERFETVSQLYEALRPFADSALNPSASMVQSREEAIRILAGTSAPADAAVATPSNGVGPATPAPVRTEPNGGASQVPSAWGHTQRGRHVSWQRHGIPLALVLGVLGGGAYWASHLSSHNPSVIPTEGHLSNAPASARTTPNPAARSPGPAEPAPTPPAPVAAAPAVPEQLAPVPPEPSTQPAGAAPEAKSAVPPGVPPGVPAGVAPVSTGAPRVRLLPGAAAAAVTAPRLQAAAPPAKPVRVQEQRPGSRPAETSPASGTPGARAAEPVSSDKSRAEPSTRGALDVPDFGGRE